jgi:uncharacterized protein YajQ (UPF0234 family)
VTNRFDFKGVDAGFELQDRRVLMHAEAEFQLEQMVDILRGRSVTCRARGSRCAWRSP